MSIENNTTAEAVETPQEETKVGVRLFVSNIGFKQTYEEVVNALSAHGKVIDLTLPVDTLRKTNKGYAICRVSEACAAVLLESTVALNGRILRIQPAR